MNERIKKHVESLFVEAPQTIKIKDLKTEMLADLDLKYDDYIKNGSSEEDAFREVISGIGDVSDLIRQIENEKAFNRDYLPEQRKKSALFVSISIMLYILSIPMLIILSELTGHGTVGVVAMFSCAAVATGLLIYNAMSRPRYVKEDENVVEDFKEWRSETKYNKRLRKAISSVMWPLIVAVYLLYSFFTGAWAFSWLIFIFGVVAEAIIKLIFVIKSEDDS